MSFNCDDDGGGSWEEVDIYIYILTHKIYKHQQQPVHVNYRLQISHY